jgi:hypothetical protein
MIFSLTWLASPVWKELRRGRNPSATGFGGFERYGGLPFKTSAVEQG